MPPLSKPKCPRGLAPGVETYEIIKSQVWRAHLNGETPEAIAAKVAERWGGYARLLGREVLADPASVAGWLARQRARRGCSASTRLARLSQLESGLEILRGELADAYARFELGDMDGGRDAAVGAISAVCEFIEGYADVPGGKLSVPLSAVGLALSEVGSGITHPMLEKPKVGHRVPAGQATQTVAAVAVMALEAAVRDGLALKPASDQVARELRRRGYTQASGKPITAATLRNWRARASEGPGGHHQAAQEILSRVRSFAARGGTLHRPGLAAVLDSLDDWARQTGVRRKPRS